MTLLSDGTIAVLDASAPFLHLLGPTGKHLGAFLRAGEGPGSARMPLSITPDGRDLWVWDPGNRRLTLFDRAGKILRELPIRVEGNVVPLARNRFLVVPFTGFGPGLDSLRTVRLPIVDSTGRNLSTLYTYVDVVKALNIPSAGGARVGRQPLKPSAMPLASPGGNGVAVVFPTVVDRPGGAAFRLVRFAPSGQQLFDGWVPVTGVRVGSSQVEAAVRFLSSGPDSLDPSVPKRVRAAIEVPKYMPAASVGFAGRNGETWLRDYGLGREERDWFVVSATGQIVGRIPLASGERILGLLGERIVTTRDGPTGEPEWSIHRVVRR
jgi:hypothetical protein